MFPEIVRDEVFRLETRRLWLRWPTLGDAFDAPQAKAGAQDASGSGLRLPGMACIAAWRGAVERGDGLHLVLEDKNTRAGIGAIHLTLPSPRQGVLDYQLVPARRGEGLMTEAVQALVHMTFLLDVALTITAAPLAADRRGREVLERCGFTYVGSGMRSGAPGAGLAACDHFRLDRRTWASLCGWGASGRHGAPPRRASEPARMSVHA